MGLHVRLNPAIQSPQNLYHSKEEEKVAQGIKNFKLRNAAVAELEAETFAILQILAASNSHSYCDSLTNFQGWLSNAAKFSNRMKSFLTIPNENL